MERIRRRAFVPYKEALDTFMSMRKEINDSREKGDSEFLKKFENLKERAANEDAVAMDLLAYYYKSGVPGLLPENYMRYVTWEIVAAARGNEFAIEKLQFLINLACEKIITSDDYETIKYKNDIDEYNALYVVGKNLCKVLVKDFLKAYPVNLVELEDDYQPYEQKHFVTLRRYIEEAVPKTIVFMK